MPLNPPDIKELKAIVDWVNLADDVRELSIKFGDVELFISRDRTGSAAVAVAPVAAPAAPTPVSAVASAPAEPSAPAVAAPAPASGARPFSADTLSDDEVLVKAPMVGVFYAAPKPGDPPFVSVGDSVTSSTVVGIVEVMKLMNNLEAKVDGIITRILVENEQAVEYGQPLLVVKRNG